MSAHLPDLESDFSVFYRVDDIYSMPAPEFLSKAWRVSAYGGMMTLHRQALNTPAAPSAGTVPQVQVTYRPAARSVLPVLPVHADTVVVDTVGALDLATRTADGSLFERVTVSKADLAPE